MEINLMSSLTQEETKKPWSHFWNDKRQEQHDIQFFNTWFTFCMNYWDKILPFKYNLVLSNIRSYLYTIYYNLQLLVETIN